MFLIEIKCDLCQKGKLKLKPKLLFYDEGLCFIFKLFFLKQSPTCIK